MPALHIDKGQFGWALSAFQMGYALMQIPGGGARRPIWRAPPPDHRARLLVNLYGAVTGLAGSLAGLIVVRVFFGLGEGLQNGGQFKLVGDNFDSRERSRASAIFLSAFAIGPAIASPIVTTLIANTGWRGVLFRQRRARTDRRRAAGPFSTTNAASARHRAASDRSKACGCAWARRLAKSAGSAHFMACPSTAYLFFNVAYWSFIYWIPTYLSDTRHITLAKLGWISSIPYLCGFVGIVALGYLGSQALRRWRAALVAVAYLFAAFFLYRTFIAASLAPCLVAISLAAFCLYGGFGPFWAVALDLTDENRRGAFAGFVNFGGADRRHPHPDYRRCYRQKDGFFHGRFSLYDGARSSFRRAAFWRFSGTRQCLRARWLLDSIIRMRHTKAAARAFFCTHTAANCRKILCAQNSASSSCRYFCFCSPPHDNPHSRYRHQPKWKRRTESAGAI